MPGERQLALFGGAAEEADGEPRRRMVAAVPPTAEQRELAARLPPQIRIGTSSWSFPGWTGIVYDRAASTAVLARRGLAAYARHPLLRLVGIDRTYYTPLAAEDLAAYADVVPDDFRFLIKAPERCSVARFPQHARYGAERGAPNPLFLDAAWARDAICAPVAEGLADKAGVVVFQFPPQPPEALGEADAFAARLHAFLDALPRGLLYAVELRTAALLTRRYAQALSAVGACHCLNVHPSMPPLPAQAAIGDVARAPALVVRWMLGHSLAYEQARERYQPFDRLVAEDGASRAAIARLCRDSARQRRAVFVTINNKAEGSAPLSAFRLAAEIAAASHPDALQAARRP